MPDNTIAELQKEMDKLGIEPATLTEDKTLEASLVEDEPDFDPSVDLDKTIEDKENVQEEEQKNQPPIKVPNKEKAQEAIKERIERRGNRIKALEDKFGTVETTLKNIESLLQNGKPQQAEDKISSYAEKHNLNADGIKELVGIIKEDLGVIKQEEKPIAKNEEFPDVFKEEWEELLPKLEEQYPNATATQIREAQKLMDEISHSTQQLANYELEDILNSPKYSQQFKDLLFSQKKKTFEAGRTIEHGKLEEDIDFDNSNIDNPKKALDMQKALYKATGGVATMMYESGNGRSEVI